MLSRKQGTNAVLAMAVTLAASRIAPAQALPDVETMHREGMTLREQHRDREALDVFRRIYERTHEPRALARIGLAEAALGQWVIAEEHLLAALGASEDPWIAPNLAALRAALEQVRTHVGDVVVQSNTPGAEVWIEGARVATLPHTDPLRAVVGTVAVEIRAPGFITETRPVEVSASGPARVTVTLTSATPAASPVVVTPPVMVAPVVAIAPTHSETAPHGHTYRTLAWVSGISGAVFLVTGVVATGVGASAASRWNDNSMCLVQGGGSRAAQCGGSQSTAHAMGVLAPVGLVGGGLLAVTSVLLFVMNPDAHMTEHATAASWRCGAGPGALGVACGASF